MTSQLPSSSSLSSSSTRSFVVANQFPTSVGVAPNKVYLCPPVSPCTGVPPTHTATMSTPTMSPNCPSFHAGGFDKVEQPPKAYPTNQLASCWHPTVRPQSVNRDIGSPKLNPLLAIASHQWFDRLFNSNTGCVATPPGNENSMNQVILNGLMTTQDQLSSNALTHPFIGSISTTNAGYSEREHEYRNRVSAYRQTCQISSDRTSPCHSGNPPPNICSTKPFYRSKHMSPIYAVPDEVDTNAHSIQSPVDSESEYADQYHGGRLYQKERFPPESKLAYRMGFVPFTGQHKLGQYEQQSDFQDSEIPFLDRDCVLPRRGQPIVARYHADNHHDSYISIHDQRLMTCIPQDISRISAAGEHCQDDKIEGESTCSSPTEIDSPINSSFNHIRSQEDNEHTLASSSPQTITKISNDILTRESVCHQQRGYENLERLQNADEAVVTSLETLARSVSHFPTEIPDDSVPWTTAYASQSDKGIPYPDQWDRGSVNLPMLNSTLAFSRTAEAISTMQQATLSNCPHQCHHSQCHGIHEQATMFDYITPVYSTNGIHHHDQGNTLNPLGGTSCCPSQQPIPFQSTPMRHLLYNHPFLNYPSMDSNNIATTVTSYPGNISSAYCMTGSGETFPSHSPPYTPTSFVTSPPSFQARNSLLIPNGSDLSSSAPTGSFSNRISNCQRGSSAAIAAAAVAVEYAHHTGGAEIDYNPRELEAFSERFKQRRIKLGVTQADVGKALGNLKIAGVGSLSQSTICRFESLTLSHNNMVALKPVLQAWLEEAEAEAAERTRHPDMFDLDEERRRKRTSITDSEKRSLEAFFSVQPRPSSDKIAQIAEKLNLKKNVVRVWFCNQRQKQKRMKFSTLGLLHHSVSRI